MVKSEVGLLSYVQSHRKYYEELTTIVQLFMNFLWRRILINNDNVGYLLQVIMMVGNRLKGGVLGLQCLRLTTLFGVEL